MVWRGGALQKKEECFVRNPKNIAIGVVFVLFLIFLFQNTDVVTLHLYFWKVSMSQIILIPVVLLVGFACGFAVGKLMGRKKKQGQNQTVPQV
jgi:uncharacterized integral membrane protein